MQQVLCFVLVFHFLEKNAPNSCVIEVNVMIKLKDKFLTATKKSKINVKT